MTTDLTQFAGSGKTLYQQTFTSSGTWTKPSGVDLVWISASGGGGGGGGSRSALSGYQGAYVRNGGGGHAGYWILDMPIVASGNLTITIGAAGSAGTTSHGGDGGATSVTDGGVVVINCDGGSRGLQRVDGTDADISQYPDYGNLWAGGRGGLGYYYHYQGSDGGDNPVRVHRPVGTTSYGAGGGSNPFGSGGNGASTGNGGAAGGNGGGGGGGGRASATSGYTVTYYNGGAGTKGIVIVKWLA